MNKLIITAHPNPEWFTHKIAKEFITNSKDRHKIKEIDLYKDQRRQDFMQVNEKNRPIDDDLKPKMQELITWADEIVFIFPIRWFDAPAILKNRFDINMSHGFAFKYSGSVIPRRLLKGTKARIFLTTGGPKFVSYTIWLSYYITRCLWRLWFVGIKLKSYTVFWNMNKLRYPKDRAKMLKKVASIASKA